MSGKKIDMSVFIGQDFDCEFCEPDDTGKWLARGALVNIEMIGTRATYQSAESRKLWDLCRPRLNHGHFNDGSMVLPKGLVVEFMSRNGVDLIGVSAGRDSIAYREGITPALICLSHASPICMPDIIAIKIIGVHPDYSEWGKAHSMEVVEL